MDPNLSESDPGFKYGLVMLTACQVGPNADKIARRACLPRSEARKLAADCRRNGVFSGKYIVGAAEWFKPGGGMAFWCDVCVAQGLLKRTV